ncbi:SacI homology domain-domain-containing protein [Leucosporidium creatinivorum]|uniref:phosphoinositide 5-phosphatase n=1 Tax=Leucosporidium creatinivorum TaxID=106004 RepID=A0A1Y2ELU2_9BASI|nr:SacI homology domain-domain-containing protein [Leucosporidium creatinivorum]
MRVNSRRTRSELRASHLVSSPPLPSSLCLFVSTGRVHYCLVFRKPPPNAESQGAASVVVEFLPKGEVDLDVAVLLNGRVSGCLGVLRIADETFLPIITSSTTLGSSPSSLVGYGVESISRILQVEFYCLTSDFLDDTASYQASGSRAEPLEHPCAPIRKILSAGSFYYSAHFDISTRLEIRQAREAEKASEKGKEVEHEDFDSRFMWNTFLVTPLLNFRTSLAPASRDLFDRQAFVVLAIQGYAGTYNISLGGQPAVLSLISRLGWKRAGTRFNVRGVDDSGNVANAVETECILRTPSTCFSYAQVRGSVPLFWEEGGQQPFALKITITRPPEASLPAFVRHFEDLVDTYGDIHAINLLSAEKEGEIALTNAFEAHLVAAGQVEESIREQVAMTHFDFHAKSRIGGIESVKAQLASTVGPVEEQFGACIIGVDQDGGGSLVVGQRGVFRTNCKDCLDRTNVVQDLLCRFALENFILNADPSWQNSDSALWNSHRVLWAENGDALSKQYTGTGALNTSFTRSGKKSFAGLLSDGMKSVGRVYQSQFVDGGKQRAIDALLGHLANSQKIRVFNPINDQLRARLHERASEYTSHEDVTLWCGTYNLNGKAPGSESLLPWLFPQSGPDPSLIVISFQEIVPLTPQMIMATDPERLRRWEAHILRCVAERPGKKSDYILLRSGQLVGTALIVLIKTELANEVRNVEAATKKTGLKGMAGNKGAVAIRLDYRDTSFCFLTAHLAAGHSNVEERNADWATLERGLHFSKGKGISSHDNVVWAADTNYRISLPNEEVRRLAQEDDYAALLAADQLGTVMRTRGVFAGYYEAPVLFRPTYKYDNFSDQYDTSEKQRIPAWTDRILYSGKDMDVNRYQRAELMASDHRPVYAIFRAHIRSVDQVKRAALRKEIHAEIIAHSPQDKLDDKLSRFTNGVATGDLPPPSDDQQAWWNGRDGNFDIDPPSSAPRNPGVTNPFDSAYFLPSPSSRPTPPLVPKKPFGAPPPVRRKPPPPAPAAAITLDTTPGVGKQDDSLLTPSTALKPKPPVPQRPGAQAVVKRSVSSSSLLDEGEDEPVSGSWQVIEPVK